MKIKVITISGKEIEIKNIFEFNLTQTAGIPCDCLSFYFKHKAPIDEIVSVRAYQGKKIIFNGLCDCQKMTQAPDGFEIFIYARSSASLLVDNEAEPFTYNRPTANQLYFNYAKDFGFTSVLPDIYSNDKYEVAKGSSCFGAINQFVYLKSGKNIYVSPDNEIGVYEQTEDEKSLDKYKIISFASTVNRSEPISCINFKRALGESGYRLHTKSGISDSLAIKRNQYINLSALPQWQREYIILQKLRASYEDYKTVEITVSGAVEENLYQRFSFNRQGLDYDDYVLMEKKYIFDEKGERTKLLLKKMTEIEGITYVD